MRGETVASEVVNNDDLLWGSVFRCEPSMPPGGTCRYLPAITRPMPLCARNASDSGIRIKPKVNVSFIESITRTFFADGAQKSGPSGSTTPCVTSKQLDEEVFSHLTMTKSFVT